MSTMEASSEVAVGWTDGNRFVAIRPPLTDGELHELKQANLVPGSIEHIDIDPACTQIGFPVIMSAPESATRRAQGLAAAIAGFLRTTRGDVIINFEPVSLTGHKSSPFKPYTDA